MLTRDRLLQRIVGPFLFWIRVQPEPDRNAYHHAHCDTQDDRDIDDRRDAYDGRDTYHDGYTFDCADLDAIRQG